MFWDPFDPYGRARRRRVEEQRRLEEQRRRAEQEALRRALLEEEARRRAAESPPPQATIAARFEEELIQARRERDEWADRYKQILQSWEEEQQTLNTEREALQSEVEETRERLRAEAEANRERVLRNAEQRAFEENRQTLLRLLDVADNLERALSQIGDEQSPLAEGVRITYRDFRRALEQVGVEKMESVGQPFNPTLFEAVASHQAEGVEEGQVIAEIAPGYQYRGALLRPAKVVIAV